MKTLLFIYIHSLDGIHGAPLGTRKAYTALSEKYILKEYFIGKRANKLLSFIRNIFLYSGYLSPFDIARIMKFLKKNIVEIVFFDISTHGRLVKKIKLKYPDTKVVVNYHNNEGKYHFDFVKSSGYIYLPRWFAAWYNEKMSLKYSDLNIFITENDKMSLCAETKPSIIIPATMEDKFKQDKPFKNKEGKYILFVGAAFYANIKGACFLINDIANNISCNVFIAGKGMRNALKKEKIPKNVAIEDFIEDLSEAYNSASAFVAPLFVGSGMKLKLVEAMMYGKKIIATPLAFYGFKTDIPCFSICSTAQDFIREINNTDMTKTFYEDSRQLYLGNYSASSNNKYYSQIEEYFNKKSI